MGAEPNTIHIAMFPWFAFGHFKIFLHLSNKLAQKCHKIYFLAPTKTLPKLQPFNHHPDLITFVPVTVPHVDGLPSDVETTKDVLPHMGTLLATAFDRTEDSIKNLLRDLRVDVVFFDFAYWLPKVANQLGIKSVYFDVFGPAPLGFLLSLERKVESDFLDLSGIKLQPHEERAVAQIKVMEYGDKIQIFSRLFTGMIQTNMVACKASREIEGEYCDYLEAQLRKPILLTGPFIPEPLPSLLEEKWDSWLSKFKAGSVVYCAFGSECILSQDQFQEVVLGLELTGLPFLAELKTPVGAKSVQSALPENFEERTMGRGIVHGEWVEAQMILGHPSVGCFITHCGSNSLSEALLSTCQLVLLPEKVDQAINARMMAGGHLKVGVEVHKGDEDGLFTKEAISKAVGLVVDEDSEIGLEVRANHTKIRETFLHKDLEPSYIDDFNNKLKELIA